MLWEVSLYQRRDSGVLASVVFGAGAERWQLRAGVTLGLSTLACLVHRPQGLAILNHLLFWTWHFLHTPVPLQMLFLPSEISISSLLPQHLWNWNLSCSHIFPL